MIHFQHPNFKEGYNCKNWGVSWSNLVFQVEKGHSHKKQNYSLKGTLNVPTPGQANPNIIQPWELPEMETQQLPTAALQE